jgi:hypothetical protein
MPAVTVLLQPGLVRITVPVGRVYATSSWSRGDRPSGVPVSCLTAAVSEMLLVEVKAAPDRVDQRQPEI